ncbi:hypothetical protein CHH48_09065 [Terribacillus saccharophilus]|uniref:Serine aminopeptidase S33 domain-containing protein n=1 Tax=Terribacillus saccharophilus TaxID=361277 RepID=A0ABX4GZ40_9BACI|nr:hypothetical protein CHH56_08400 [Terribacillus saccharophilus]PAD96566.1 hypothetical protein CHH50_08160 [Terribacillus saccharophilus]PAE00142.1 hypothetical protein CHH48_09065 [Terribacillus saccharophilus]
MKPTIQYTYSDKPVLLMHGDSDQILDSSGNMLITRTAAVPTLLLIFITKSIISLLRIWWTAQVLAERKFHLNEWALERKEAPIRLI